MTPSPRLVALDAVRGVAVLLMIEQHLGVWLWRGPGASGMAGQWPLVAFNALGGGAAPAFILLAGAGLTLLARARPRPDLELLKRSGLLFAFAYAFSAAVPSWFSMQSWYVLHLMAAGQLSAIVTRRWPSLALALAAAAVILGAAVIQTQLHVPHRLSNDWMSGRVPGSPATPLSIMLVEGQFPLFPWLGVFWAGMLVGRCTDWASTRSLLRLGGAVLALGASCLVLGEALRGGGQVWARIGYLSVPFFPASPAMIALLIGIIVIGIALAIMLEVRGKIAPEAAIVQLGRCSLTALIVHVVIFREGSLATGLWGSLSPLQTGGVIAIVWVLVLALARRWSRHQFRYGAEWLLRRAAGAQLAAKPPV